MSTVTLRVFIGHAFAPRCGSYSLNEFRLSVQKLLQSTEDHLKSKGVFVDIHPILQFSDFSKSINEQLIAALRMADIAILDVSDNNPNVFFEFGFLSSQGMPTIILKSKQSAASGYELPVDVAGRLFFEYDSIEDITNLAHLYLNSLVERVFADRRLPKGIMQSVWFGPMARDLQVICPPSFDQLPSMNLTAANYTFLDNFGDKDAMHEISLFLARFYGARVLPFTSDNFPAKNLLRNNLVVIGGPGINGSEGNALTQQISARYKSRVRYSDDGESLTVEQPGGSIPLILKPRQNATGAIIADPGYFARIPNPFNRDSVVILIHGCHTLGVTGAAQAFSDNPSAVPNFEAILSIPHFASERDIFFETVFSVDVIDGDAIVPQVRQEWVFPISMAG